MTTAVKVIVNSNTVILSKIHDDTSYLLALKNNPLNKLPKD